MTPPKHALAPDGPPIPTLMAGGPNGLELDVPIAQARVTAIVYHGVGDATRSPSPRRATRRTPAS